ncbi:MAG: hypothetical protein HY951_08685 [Bacteroidia bacterium]|nr:hypothetical protein [Bacteroidia bacterium]
MRKLFFLSIFVMLSMCINAQTPQGFQYQAVIRDASGTAMVNQSVNFQISIISGSVSGTPVYIETHIGSTNAYGIVVLNIGSGTPVTGTLSAINWESASHFIKVEADPTGGTSYLDMGTTQLLSVPYALNSLKANQAVNADNATNANYATVAGTANYVGGTGIDITGSVVTNTAPDQTVSLTQGGSTTISGTYPNFTISSTDNNTTYNAGTGINVTGTTISNTAPDQTITLSQSGATTVTGTYPNFTISSTDNNTTYTAGSGLSLTGTTFVNTAPDQTVTMTSGTGISVTGSYPSYTVTNSSPNATHTGDVTGSGALTIANNAVTTSKIADGNVTAVKLNNMSATNGQVLKFNGTNWAPAIDANTTYTAGAGLSLSGTLFANTAPDQTVSLTQGGATTISGTYPNFTISSTDLNSGTPGGFNKTVQFNNSGSFGGDTAMTWDNANKRLGVGLTNPNGRLVVRGSALAPATEPLFEVKNAAGQTVFVVYPDSVHIYVKDGGAKSNKGGFAVSGRNSSKAFTNNFLSVTPDSTRIFTGDTISGFGVENLGAGASTSYMHLTPNNYFIGHLSGDAITSGLYNSFVGYQSGKSNSNGSYNVFMGYQTGFANVAGAYNTFIGYLSGKFNTSSDNTFLGYKAGMSHQTGGGNVFIGSKAGQNDISGVQNIFIGENSGFSNNNGSYNVSLGFESGFNNVFGSYNTFLGYQSGYNNINASNNVIMGYQSGFNNNGNSNVLLGNQCGYSNTWGYSNVMLGNMAGYSNVNGFVNTFIGELAGYYNTDGTNNVFIGYQSGYKNTIANGNIFIGRQTGYNNLTGHGNLFMGNYAGFMNTAGANNVYLGYNAGMNSLGNNNVNIGQSANEHNVNGINNVSLGAFAGFWSTGNYNLFLGYQAGNNNTGSNNIFLGENSGYNDFGSGKLYIENSSNITNPLVNGDFTNDRFAVNRQADTYPFQVGTDATTGNGAYLTAGGTWTNTSSITLKDRFVTINNNDFLTKIKNLEIKGWFYKETQEYHIGPFAEDFYNAFGTGVLNEPNYLGKSLAASDVAGVSLLAVQQLIKEIELLKAEIEKLKAAK